MKRVLTFCRYVGKELINDYNRHNISRLSAETTYYLILSIVPFLIIILSAITVFLNHDLDTIKEALMLLPPESQSSLLSVIDVLAENQSNTLFSVSIIFAFWTLAQSTKSLINAINTILGLDDLEESFIKMITKALFFTFIGATTGFMGLVLSVYGQSFLELFGEMLAIPKPVIKWGSTLATWLPLASMWVSLSLFYHYAPRHKTDWSIPWRRAFIGGFIGTILWLLLTIGYRVYITDIAGGGSANYGPLVGIMILFIWLNWSVQTILVVGSIIHNNNFISYIEAFKNQRKTKDE
ncbi:YihY/virulence factor BrkB family protein [uncultured Veillonella sp.]|uniref:YihY/virulence factor BrkB family protein n=1 Tax=uncultured Veillonella sp. TaxID=159268 RepID=UPI00261BBF3C|nr:YihY/virulence factor BrkB family protein [uncultured Veillonella sp.]